MRERLTFWLHVVLVIIFILSPILFDWRIIIAGAVLFYIQILVLGNCVLTLIQFGSKKSKKSFYHHWLKTMGLNFSEKKVKFFILYVKPGLTIIFGVLLQVIFHFRPLVI